MTAPQHDVGMHTPGQLSNVPSASVTETTVFQGLNHNDSMNGSQIKGHNQKDSSNAADRMVTPGSGSFAALQNNLVNESPVTMMDMSEDKGRLGIAGDKLIHGDSKASAGVGASIAGGGAGGAGASDLSIG